MFAIGKADTECSEPGFQTRKERGRQETQVSFKSVTGSFPSSAPEVGHSNVDPESNLLIEKWGGAPPPQ